VPLLCLFVPTQNQAVVRKPLIRNGGDDGTRTRGLCRDRVPTSRNLLKAGGMDSALPPSKAPLGTLIGRVVDARFDTETHGSGFDHLACTHVQNVQIVSAFERHRCATTPRQPCDSSELSGKGADPPANELIQQQTPF
jgi:hypothetical protein